MPRCESQARRLAFDSGRRTSHVAVFRMGEDGLAHWFWDVGSDQQTEDAFWV